MHSCGPMQGSLLAWKGTHCGSPAMWVNRREEGGCCLVCSAVPPHVAAAGSWNMTGTLCQVPARPLRCVDVLVRRSSCSRDGINTPGAPAQHLRSHACPRPAHAQLAASAFQVIAYSCFASRGFYCISLSQLVLLCLRQHIVEVRLLRRGDDGARGGGCCCCRCTQRPVVAAARVGPWQQACSVRCLPGIPGMSTWAILPASTRLECLVST
jgi:hypothetical protein